MKALPKVSLLVCMRNETGYIERCLASLFTQDYPAENLEILVLDGRSTDGSKEIVARLFEGRENCLLIDNPGVIQANGWNLGIQKSTGEIVGIVSGHCELASDYVSTAVETLQRTGADLVGGPMRAVSASKVGQAIALATSTPFGVGNARFHYADKEVEVDTVYMGLCWRRLYQQVGGFDAAMVCNEDDELSYRILKRGGRIICNPAIRSRYFNRASLSSLWRQYYRYGCWKVRVMEKHLGQVRVRQFVPPLFVSSLIISAILGLFHPIGEVLLLAAIVLYATANALASVKAGYNSRRFHLALLPLVFGILHLSYGLGFLNGLIDRLLLRRKVMPNTAVMTADSSTK